jgi:nicotinamide riboside transporter PnuC
MRWLGREPAQWAHLLGGIFMMLVPILHLSVDLTGAVLAVIAAVSGVVTAAAVSGEKAAALVAGLIKALIAVALAVHFDLSPEVQAGIMIAVEAAVGFYLRTQVIAPVPPAIPDPPVTQPAA